MNSVCAYKGYLNIINIIRNKRSSNRDDLELNKLMLQHLTRTRIRRNKENIFKSCHFVYSQSDKVIYIISLKTIEYAKNINDK